MNKGVWTASEDERLCEAVKDHGTKWARVATDVETRNGDQCSKRWNDTVNPEIDHSAWTPQEVCLPKAYSSRPALCFYANLSLTTLTGRVATSKGRTTWSQLEHNCSISLSPTNGLGLQESIFPSLPEDEWRSPVFYIKPKRSIYARPCQKTTYYSFS